MEKGDAMNLPERPDLQVQINCKIDIEKMAEILTPAQIKAVMLGIGQVVSATNPRREIPQTILESNALFIGRG